MPSISSTSKRRSPSSRAACSAAARACASVPLTSHSRSRARKSTEVACCAAAAAAARARAPAGSRSWARVWSSQARRLRQRALHRLRVWHGTRPHRDAALRHPRHPHPLRFGCAFPRAVRRRLMNVSYRWLQDLIPGLKLTPSEVADVLAAQGAPVDEIVDVGAPLREVVIARVAEARQHPNADRLSLCTVDAGTGAQLQVVCGAPNVRADRYYPFAPVGASLPGGIIIKKAKIRGSESQGMLCSARELGLG